MTYVFLKNTVNLINSYMQDVIEYEGVDREMANFVAQDRNDAIKVKEMILDQDYKEASEFLNLLDTYPREGLVMALIADLGADVVKEKLGFYCV